MIGLKKFGKNKFNISIINCYGEWDKQASILRKKNIDIINLQKKIRFNTDVHGYIKSRLIYLFTFFLSYRKLKNLLKKDPPDYLIVHLLTFIPLYLFLNNSFKTKLILRISGKPRLSLFRNLLWRLSNKYIYIVFCPTLETKNYLLKRSIFNSKKIKFLPDPVLYNSEIDILSKRKVLSKFKKESYFLSVGRLTKQKNHELLIKLFQYNEINEKLLIIGEGELSDHLKNLIKNLNLYKKIKILNYQKNIFYYIKRSKGVIIPSLWEDPGFVMIESAHFNKTVICSDCPSGPKEFVGNNKGGFLFKSNSLNSLRNAMNKFNKSKKKIL